MTWCPKSASARQHSFFDGYVFVQLLVLLVFLIVLLRQIMPKGENVKTKCG